MNLEPGAEAPEESPEAAQALRQADALLQTMWVRYAAESARRRRLRRRVHPPPRPEDVFLHVAVWASLGGLLFGPMGPAGHLGGAVAGAVFGFFWRRS